MCNIHIKNNIEKGSFAHGSGLFTRYCALTDGGLDFVSEQFQSPCEMLRVSHRVTLPNHLQAHGMPASSSSNQSCVRVFLTCIFPRGITIGWHLLLSSNVHLAAGE